MIEMVRVHKWASGERTPWFIPLLVWSCGHQERIPGWTLSDPVPACPGCGKCRFRHADLKPAVWLAPQHELEPVVGRDGRIILYDMFVGGKWIGSRSTVEQCDTALKHYETRRHEQS